MVNKIHQEVEGKRNANVTVRTNSPKAVLTIRTFGKKVRVKNVPKNVRVTVNGHRK